MGRQDRRLGPMILSGALWVPAAAAMGHGDLAPRIAALTTALAARPADPTLLLARADLYRQDGDPWSAFRDLRAAEHTDPQLPGLGTAWARVHLMRGHPDLALAALERASGHPEEPADQNELRARALAGLGRPAEAAVAWRAQIASHERAMPDEFHACATAYRESGQLDAALSIVELGLARVGPCASLELLAADLEKAAGRIDDASMRLQRLALDAPRPESWWLRRATLLRDAGREFEARREATHALDALLRLPAHVRERPLTREQIETARGLLTTIPDPNERSDDAEHPDDRTGSGGPCSYRGGAAAKSKQCVTGAGDRSSQVRHRFPAAKSGVRSPKSEVQLPLGRATASTPMPQANSAIPK